MVIYRLRSTMGFKDAIRTHRSALSDGRRHEVYELVGENDIRVAVANVAKLERPVAHLG
jgi:hypothetical protein